MEKPSANQILDQLIRFVSPGGEAEAIPLREILRHPRSTDDPDEARRVFEGWKMARRRLEELDAPGLWAGEKVDLINAMASGVVKEGTRASMIMMAVQMNSNLSVTEETAEQLMKAYQSVLDMMDDVRRVTKKNDVKEE